MRKLAERTKTATELIIRTINDIHDDVGNASSALSEGVGSVQNVLTLAHKVMEALQLIMAEANSSDSMVSDINSALSEQTQASTGIAIDG